MKTVVITGVSTGIGKGISSVMIKSGWRVYGSVRRCVVVLTFLLPGDRRTTAILFALAVFISLSDGLVILREHGFTPAIYIYWGTALYMIIIAAFLFRRRLPN